MGDPSLMERLLIAGIGWVGELIERAGGDDIFGDLRTRRAAAERVVSSEQVCRADPEIIVASWCGKPVQAAAIASRRGCPLRAHL